MNEQKVVDNRFQSSQDLKLTSKPVVIAPSDTVPLPHHPAAPDDRVMQYRLEILPGPSALYKESLVLTAAPSLTLCLIKEQSYTLDRM